MKRESPYVVPEGYFEDMKRNLRGIPSACPRRKNRRTLPCLAFAAVAVAAALVYGLFFYGRSSGAQNPDDVIVEYLMDSRLSLYEIGENLL